MPVATSLVQEVRELRVQGASMTKPRRGLPRVEIVSGPTLHPEIIAHDHNEICSHRRRNDPLACPACDPPLEPLWSWPQHFASTEFVPMELPPMGLPPPKRGRPLTCFTLPLARMVRLSDFKIGARPPAFHGFASKICPRERKANLFAKHGSRPSSREVCGLQEFTTLPKRTKR